MSSNPVSVTLTADAASTATSDDYSFSAPFIIAAGQTVASGTVTIAENDIMEADKTLILSASGTGLTVTPATVTITDNNSPGVTISKHSMTVDIDSTETYTVKLNTQPTAPVTVTAMSGAEATATVAQSALTFTTSNWRTEQTFTVTGVAAGSTSVTHTASSTDSTYGSRVSVPGVRVKVYRPPQEQQQAGGNPPKLGF
ncbi:MAG: hypothetical protein KTU85_12765 [Acidimicrobiia bacterium]|nr:hypothetical protein [Acidimicrobiia bacterium]